MNLRTGDVQDPQPGSLAEAFATLVELQRRSPNVLLIPDTSSSTHVRENLAGAGLSLSWDDVLDLDSIGR